MCHHKIFCLLFLHLFFSFNSNAQSISVFSQLAISEENLPKIKSGISNNNSNNEILIFLGDFSQDLSKEQIIESIDELLKDVSKVYVVPGNHEWENWGAKGVRDFENMLRDEFDYDVLLPDNACGELDIVELDNDLVIVALDAEWYIRNWERTDYINRNCEINTRVQFWRNIDEEISSYRAQKVLLLSYYPPVRFDNSAGYFPFKDHIFPLQRSVKPLFLPLPFIGTLLLNGEAYLNDRTSITHPVYREFANHLEKVIENYPNVTIVSGEANHLMLADFENSTVINTYSGESPDYTRKSRTTFAAKKSGFVHFERQKDSLMLSFNTFSNSEKKRTLYSVSEKDRDELTDQMDNDFIELMERVEKYEPIDTSILEKGDIYEMNGFFWGNLNTDIYYRNIEVPRLYLNSYKGGATPVRLGGGQQTISLRIKAKDGHTYNLRSLKKEPNNILPGFFDFSILRNVVEFNFTAANPYGFLSAPTLQKAADVLYTEPEMYYVPIQKALKPYNEEIGEALYMVRTRADEDWTDNPAMGSTDEFEGSIDLIEELKEGKASVDLEMYLRARMIDLLINDWDRHDDQWRWAMVGEKGEKDFYQPIPRDRDQAFANFDGFFSRVLVPFNLDVRRFWPYDGKISKVEVRWTHQQARYLDNILLGRLDYKSFIEEAQKVKSSLSYDIVEEAVKKMPDAVTSEEKSIIIKNIESRKNTLEKTSSILFKQINRSLFLFGTVEKDSVFIDRQKNGDIEIKLFHKEEEKDDDAERKKWIHDYTRTIKANKTKQVNLMTLAGDDIFILQGKHKGPRINLIGGYGDDIYTDNIKGISIRKKNIIYEDNKKTEITTNGSSRLRYTESKSVHEINREIFNQPYQLYNPLAAFNTDDGIFIGGQMNWTNFTYRTKYKSTLKGIYAFGTGSSELRYSLEIDNDLRQRSVYLNVDFLGPEYVFNYFGAGNETEFNTEIDRDFYFVRQQKINANYGYINEVNELGKLSYGVGIERIKLEKTLERFISETSDINPEVFNPNYFVTAKVALDIENFDKPMRPKNGVKLHASLVPKIHLNGGKNQIRLNGEFGIYESLDSKDRFVFSTKIGASHIFGQYYFFDGVMLGGRKNLRGYRDERFNGRTGFYHNTNLNIQLFNKIFEGFFPSSLGVTLSFDHGRVWADSDLDRELAISNWRKSFGAAVFLSPFNEAVLSVGVFKGSEDTQVSFQFGYFF